MIIQEEFFTMRDGVRLYTRIILPCEDKKFPIVFIRNPYGVAHNGEPCPPEKYENDLFLKNGYAIVYQHVRGSGDSEGEMRPYREREDGLDTLEIIRSKPFYNGEIYVTGQSYLSTVHLCYLGTNPSDVKAAALSVQRDNMFDWRYYNGMVRGFVSFDWYYKRIKRNYPVLMDYKDAMYRPYEYMMERVIGKNLPDFTAMLMNNTYSEYWQTQENDHVADVLEIPVLFSEGWFDFYTEGMFSMWERLPEKTKAKSAMVVGPWGHATKVANAEYAFPNGNLPDDYIVEYFNSVRDHKPYKYLELGKLNYYSVCGDYWTTGTPSDKSMKLYINSDGTLSDSPRSAGERSYTYDPDKLLNYYKYDNIFKCPPKDSTDGVLSFESEPFTADTHFYGKIQWNMKVKSNCEDTAFFMRVYFVENGVAYNLTETITTLSNINPHYTAGEECLISISTGPVGFTAKAGNSIRVDISSHSDLYTPHPNIKGHWAKVTETKSAENTVLCDEDAYIVLPLE